MKLLKYIVTAMLLLTTLLMAGCGEDKFVGTWYNRVDNAIGKSIVTKDKNKDKTYSDAEYAMFYSEDQYAAGIDQSGRQIINYRYIWTDKFIANVPMTETEGKLNGSYQGIDMNVEYDDKTKRLLCRSSKTPIVTEAINEKEFDVKKVREEIKADITKKFNEAKAQNNNRKYKLVIIGDIEFVDEGKKGPLPNG